MTRASDNPNSINLPAEHGFWDYTTPIAGGMERFQKHDYLQLLDDMAEAKMNSLVICPKWMTTGYRSRLPYLDQSADNPVIASDNELLRFAISEARKRGIKVWLLAVLNIFVHRTFGPKIEARNVMADIIEFAFPEAVAEYDSDLPELADRAAEVAAELIELFPDIGGFIVELEHDNVSALRRVPLYNTWARTNGRKPFEEVGHPLNPRAHPGADWRDYTTQCRIIFVQRIERVIREKGFKGDLAVICGLAEGLYERSIELNLEMFHAQLPAASAVTYGYDYPFHRYTVKDFGIALPQSLGVKTYYLPRGIMTWNMPSLRGIKLPDHWQMDIDDLAMFQPQGLWWFGCGTVNDGVHVSLSALRQLGFKDGTAARRALLAKLKHR